MSLVNKEAGASQVGFQEPRKSADRERSAAGAAWAPATFQAHLMRRLVHYLVTVARWSGTLWAGWCMGAVKKE